LSGAPASRQIIFVAHFGTLQLLPAGGSARPQMSGHHVGPTAPGIVVEIDELRHQYEPLISTRKPVVIVAAVPFWPGGGGPTA
jgi:hypothetical protein